MDKLRAQIDKIDDELIRLLSKRMAVVKEIGAFKQAANIGVFKPEREKEIIERLSKQAGEFLSAGAIRAIFWEIFAASRNLEYPQKVAYLGPLGSHTHQAAQEKFGSLSSYLSLGSIAAVFNAVQKRTVKYGVVPIENNTEGIVAETLDLLGASDLYIVAEAKAAIHHSFVSLENDLKNIKKIYSKDIAFGQCRLFLGEPSLVGAKLIPVESTAKAASLAAQEAGAAAICSVAASKIYGVPVLYENIEDSKYNQTRFVIISDYKNAPTGMDKTTVLVKTPNEPGGLAKLLMDFYDAGINLLKIESRPIRGKKDFFQWFYIDYDGHFEDEASMRVIEKYKQDVKWLGSFVKV